MYVYAYEILALEKEPIDKKLKIVVREVEENLKLLFINLPEDKIVLPPFEEVLTLKKSQRVLSGKV